MKNKINILLTGASGTVGFEVLKQLCQKLHKYQITLFDKKSRKSLRLFSPYKEKIEIVYGDITDEECMKTICSRKQIVIHLAAIIPPLADENPKLAYRVNTLGTEYLIRGLEQYSPQAFLLYSSSISIYGDRLNDPFIKVGDPLNPSEGDEYATTKIEAERIIQRSRINWCILRLTAIIGKHKMSKLMFHMPLKTSLEIATPKDTARVFVNAIEKKDFLSKKIFNQGGGERMRLTYKEFLSRSFKIFGLGKLNFPENSFAERNFHCGYYMDGDELEQILHFREDTLESYFEKLNRSISPLKRFLTFLFRKWTKRKLLKQSEPLNAILTKNSVQIRHFF